MGSARFQHAVRGFLAANFCAPEGFSNNNLFCPRNTQPSHATARQAQKTRTPKAFGAEIDIYFVRVLRVFSGHQFFMSLSTKVIRGLSFREDT